MSNSITTITFSDGTEMYTYFQTTSMMLSSNIFESIENVDPYYQSNISNCNHTEEKVKFYNRSYLNEEWTGKVCRKCMRVTFDYKRWLENGSLASRPSPAYFDFSREEYEENDRINSENYVVKR